MSSIADRIRSAAAEVLALESAAAPTLVPGSWSARSTAPGVLWAHEPCSEAELTAFLRKGEGSNPLRLVNTDKGLAIRSMAWGTTIVADTPAGVAGDLQWWFVADASVIPDPAGTPYRCHVGKSASTEPVRVHRVDLAGNRVLVERRVTTQSMGIEGVAQVYPAAGSYPAGLYRIGKGPDGQWVRPLAAISAPGLWDDIGVHNGAARKLRQWPADNPHGTFREGYFGHRSYWDAPDAEFRDWLPRDNIGKKAGVRADAYEGDEVWLQYRMRASASRIEPGMPSGKSMFIQHCATSGSGQFFMQAGPPSTRIPSLDGRGNMLVGLTSYGDGAAPAGGYLTMPQGYGFASTADGPNWQHPDEFPACRYVRGQPPQCWHVPGDQWFTVLLHFKLGRDNAPPNPEGKSTGWLNDWRRANDWPSVSDPAYRTTYELFVAEDGGDYMKLASGTDYTWLYGDEKYEAGHYYQNPPSMQAVWLGQYLNDYIGSGSVAPPPRPHWIDYTQIICSREWIPEPRDFMPAAPHYSDGMVPFEVRRMQGAYAPADGKTTFKAAQVAPWGGASGLHQGKGVIGAWSGGCVDGSRLLFAGGGHSNGADNGVHFYDWSGTDRPVGFGLMPGSRSDAAIVVSPYLIDVYSDGRPAAIHTYSRCQWSAQRGEFVRAGGRLWVFNDAAQAWRQVTADNLAVAGNGAAVVLSPDESQVLVLTGGGSARNGFIDLTTGAFTLSGAPLWGPYSTATMDAHIALDTTRNRYLSIARSSSSQWLHTTEVNWATRTYLSTRYPTDPAGADALLGGGMFIVYDEDEDCFWAGCSKEERVALGGKFGSITRIDAGTLTSTVHALSEPVTSAGHYGRAIWLRDQRCIGLIPTYDTAPVLIKV